MEQRKSPKDYETYSRVSTLDQNVDQQEDYQKGWASKNDFKVVFSIKDKSSGRLPLSERKAFLKQLERIRELRRGLIIYNLDRLTRNWDDVTFIEKFFRENWMNCPLVSTSDPIDLSNASGRLMFRIRMATSCYMPEDMIEKQKIGIARAKEEGKYKGGKAGRRWKV